MITYDSVNYTCTVGSRPGASYSYHFLSESGSSNVETLNEKTKDKQMISEILLRFGIVAKAGTS